MYSTAVKTRAGVLTIRPLQNGDTATVQAVFDQLGERSRLLRFGYAKHALDADELAQLARADRNHHVLIAVIGGEPVGIARLARDDSGLAELAAAVADQWQGLGVGTALMRALAADAAAAGI